MLVNDSSTRRAASYPWRLSLLGAALLWGLAPSTLAAQPGAAQPGAAQPAVAQPAAAVDAAAVDAPVPDASTATEPTPDRMAQYEAAVQRGVQEFSLGNWQEACVNFQLAYELRPGPRPLRGLGMCLYEQRRYAEAVQALSSALTMDDAEVPLTPDQADSAQNLLQTAKQYVVKLTVQVAPADAVVTLDGRPLTPGTSYINHGQHRLMATRGGYQVVRDIDVRLGEELDVMLRVEPTAADAAGAAPERQMAGPDAPTLTALSIGAAGLVTAGVFGVLAIAERNSLEDGCGADKTCSDDDVSALKTYALVSDIGLGVGIAGAAIGVWLWQRTVDPSGETALMPVIGPGQVGLAAGGRL